jgi:glycosyltransferase involved in cell wall biosynthesis
MGGLGTALDRVAATAPELLVRGHHIQPLELLTYTFIPLSVGTFPHMFLHWLSARRASAFRLGIVAYPICIAVVWVPSVLLGVLAAVDFPERSAAAANGILVRLIDLHAPGLLAGLLAAAVFAAIMNSFDSQVLAVGTMFTHDIVRHYGFHDAMSDRAQIRVGRVFTVVVLAATYVLSLYVDRSIFRLGVWCFSGFAALFPVVVAALYWRRSTWQGALASTLTVAALWLWFVLGGEAPRALLGSSRPLLPGERRRSVRIAYVATGAAGMLCGTCLHDNTLAAALTRLGHDVALLPTYTPLRTDEEDVSRRRVFYGAINVYLEHKSALFRRLPVPLARLLDRPALLRRIGRLSGATDARELADLTLSVLRGEAGPQARELRALLAWLRDELRPDLVHLNVAFFLGLAPALRRELGVPVTVAVSGEDLFVDQLPEPGRGRVVAEMRRHAPAVAAMIAPSQAYAARLGELLGIEPERRRVVPLGIRLEGFAGPAPARPAAAPAGEITIGYLARLAPEKGRDLLAEAFVALAAQPGGERLRLRAAGYLARRDRPYLERVVDRLRAAGLADRFAYAGELDHAGKVRFLRALDLFSVPSLYPEAKGLSVLEAMAAGVPVVVPAHGSLPEMLAATEGGLLVQPGSASSLADALQRLIDHPAERRALGDRGRQCVHALASAERMAEATAAVFEEIVENARRSSAPRSSAPRAGAPPPPREGEEGVGGRGGDPIDPVPGRVDRSW